MADDDVPSGEIFLDHRGSMLRVRWDGDHQRLRVSIWRDGTCIATHALEAADVARLSSLTTAALVESLRAVTTTD